MQAARETRRAVFSFVRNESAARQPVRKAATHQERMPPMAKIVLVHGMFQNPKSWDRWVEYFSARGHDVTAPAWPLHAGEPAELRASPAVEPGQAAPEGRDRQHRERGRQRQAHPDRPFGRRADRADPAQPRPAVGGGGASTPWRPTPCWISTGASSRTSAIIANPLKGDEPVFMDAKTFHGAFANALSEGGCGARIRTHRHP